MQLFIALLFTIATVQSTPTPTPQLARWHGNRICLDIAVMNACVLQCGSDTVLETRFCRPMDLLFTSCFLQCTGLQFVGPRPNTCVTLCELQRLLETYQCPKPSTVYINGR